MKPWTITGFVIHPGAPVQQEWTLSIYRQHDRAQIVIFDDLGNRSPVVALDDDEVDRVVVALLKFRSDGDTSTG